VRTARGSLRLSTVLLITTATFALGVAQKAPCAAGNWGSYIQYRYLCYTDILPLYSTEQLSGSRLPYLDGCQPVAGERCDEYPPVTMYTMRLASWVGDGAKTGFYRWNVLILLLCALGTAWSLFGAVGSRALYFAAAPTLLVLGIVNWDLIAVFLATAGLYAFVRKRNLLAGILFGLGAAAKLYPALLLLPTAADLIGKRRFKETARLAGGAVGVWLITNLPFMVAAFQRWSEFYRFNSERGADFDSLWYIVCRDIPPHASTTPGSACLSVHAINLASAALFVGLVGLIWWVKAMIHPRFERWTLVFPIVVVFLIVDKVYSPQYSLWLLPLFALVLPELGTFVLFEVTDMAVFVSRFWFFGWFSGAWGTPEWVFEVAILLRTGALIWCLIRWLRRPPDVVAQQMTTAVKSQPIAA
jgi:uncharacterized membrane protein